MKTRPNLERVVDVLLILLMVTSVILLVLSLGAFAGTKPVYQGF